MCGTSCSPCAVPRASDCRGAEAHGEGEPGPSRLTGIFAYLNYDTPRERQYILNALVVGLQRLEYRGYDSAGTFARLALVERAHQSC